MGARLGEVQPIVRSLWDTASRERIQVGQRVESSRRSARWAGRNPPSARYVPTSNASSKARISSTSSRTKFVPLVWVALRAVRRRSSSSSPRPQMDAVASRAPPCGPACMSMRRCRWTTSSVSLRRVDGAPVRRLIPPRLRASIASNTSSPLPPTNRHRTGCSPPFAELSRRRDNLLRKGSPECSNSLRSPGFRASSTSAARAGRSSSGRRARRRCGIREPATPLMADRWREPLAPACAATAMARRISPSAPPSRAMSSRFGWRSSGSALFRVGGGERDDVHDHALSRPKLEPDTSVSGCRHGNANEDSRAGACPPPLGAASACGGEGKPPPNGS